MYIDIKVETNKGLLFSIDFNISFINILRYCFVVFVYWATKEWLILYKWEYSEVWKYFKWTTKYIEI